MDIILHKFGNKIGLYIDKQFVTVFENVTFEYVKKWLDKNLQYNKIYITK